MGKKKLFGLILLIGVLGSFVAIYMYNKPHKNYEQQTPDFEMTASALIQDYAENEQLANQKYLDKMLLVSGTVVDKNLSDAGELSISIEDPMFGVTCTFNASLGEHQRTLTDLLDVGQAVLIKGRCDGMLTDVRLTQCSVVE